MGGENFAPDFTLLIQLGLFFVCYFFLKKFFFGPYLKLIEMRHEKTDGLKAKAAQSHADAEKLKTDYETTMKAERRKLAAWQDEERKKISDEERKQVQAARDTVGEELKHLRAGIATEVEKTRKELAGSVQEYSSQIASKLVGKKIHVTNSPSESSKRPSAETTV